MSTEEYITELKHMISEREVLLKKAPTKLLVRGDFMDKALALLNADGIKTDSEESTKPFNLESITKISYDMLVQNTILRKKLGELEERIAGGIRVYAYQRYAGDWMSTEDYPKYNNATLILDKEEW